MLGILNQIFLFSLFSLLLASQALSAKLSVVSWNVESGGNNPAVIAQQIRDDFTGVDLWGFSEVKKSSRNIYRAATSDGEGLSSRYILGRSGGGDRLMIVYNTDRLEKMGVEELGHLRFNGGRSPLVAKFKIKSNSKQFLFMVNHLYRGNTHKRQKQARGLRDWVRNQSLPVIATGDYNFDYDVPNGPGNQAFNIFLQGDSYTWLKPTVRVSTQYSDRDNDGVNDYNSILDFVFVANGATDWGGHIANYGPA